MRAARALVIVGLAATMTQCGSSRGPEPSNKISVPAMELSDGAGSIHAGPTRYCIEDDGQKLVCEHKRSSIPVLLGGANGEILTIRFLSSIRPTSVQLTGNGQSSSMPLVPKNPTQFEFEFPPLTGYVYGSLQDSLAISVKWRGGRATYRVIVRANVG